MEGMWSEHFSDAAAEKEAAALPCFERCLICGKCNARTCRLRTSKSLKNPGRKYYSCPKCPYCYNKSFKWEDEVDPHELIEVPYCGGCTAGVCRVKKVVHGPDKGRIMFTCRVKEGQGSCGYTMWKDQLEIPEAHQAAIDTESMPENDSYQMLVELCSNKKARLDEMKCVNDHLQEEFSSTMEGPLDIETEVSLCEIEFKNSELELENVSKKNEVLEGKYLIAFKEVEESRKLQKQKEVERSAAKARLEQARELLRLRG